MKLEDVFAGHIELTASERAYAAHALEELYMRGGWSPSGMDRRTIHRQVAAKIGALPLVQMVAPDGSRLVSVEEHRALVEEIERKKMRREHIRARVSDLVSELMYYGRKEDEELPRGAIEAAVAAGEITTDEIVGLFAEELQAVKGMKPTTPNAIEAAAAVGGGGEVGDRHGRAARAEADERFFRTDGTTPSRGSRPWRR